MTTEGPSTPRLPSSLSDGERVRPKEVHFASPVAGGSSHHSSRAKGTPQAYKRRLTIDPQGEYAYKKTPSSILMSSLQLGLQHAIGSLEPKPRRDILMTDFEDIVTVDFPAAGSGCTPAHKFKDFTFKNYSPVAFRFFREAFGIAAEDFLVAMCDRPLREISNPGASGSLFYLSADDAFIIKTVQKKEAHFLQKLLPGYYLNLTQNKRTLLPKFFGLYRYKSGSVNIRIVIMNNLLPTSIRLHEKYDLKGSTYKRKASPSELLKKSPTFKDLDFGERHEEGIVLGPEPYEALKKSVERDCKVLESFGIMDYSLLLAVHNIDYAHRERSESVQSSVAGDITSTEDAPIPSRLGLGLGKNFSIISAENLPMTVETTETATTQYPEGFIQGRIRGDRVLLYLGVIDILQSYRLRKKLEHSFKSIITDGNTVSVHNPSFYARRFQDFITTQLFKKEKTKYRTRKNSTNVQLRGRKPTSVRGASARTLERQNSHPSPSHDLPTYSQATKSADSVTTSLDRQRTVSDPSSASSNLPEIPTLEVHPPRLETLESVPGVSESGSSGKPVNSDDAASGPKSHDNGSGSQEVVIERKSQPGAKIEMSEQVAPEQEAGSHEQNQIEENPNESSDFAHNVRCGTSTPIDESPKIGGDGSRTFDTDYSTGEAETLDTQHIELTVESNVNLDTETGC